MRKMFPLIALLLQLSAVYSDSHSLRYYYTAVSAPGSGLPEFSAVGYVDDREIDNYNSDSGTTRPQVEWMKKLGAEYWERQTQIIKGTEPIFRHNVRTGMARSNQTGGFHYVQYMYGCELGEDGRSIRGYDQHGYDGGEFLALDTKTWTYIPTMPQAQITTQRWNSAELQAGERQKNYLENICIEWLKKYLENGREDLERRVQPKVKVSGQEKNGMRTLHCQVYGFHPRAVHVKWMKDEMDDIPSYQTTHTLPNPDGTYQIRVTVEVIPKEGDSYSCYVDHTSLEGPVNYVWEPEKPNTWITPISVTVGVVALVVVGIFGFVWYKRRKAGYKTASTSDASSDTSHNAASA